MGSRLGSVFMLLVPALCYIYADAKNLASLDVKDYKITRNESETFEVIPTNDLECKACEEFTFQVITYLGDKKTQAEIIKSLRQACSLIPPIKNQCQKLVDKYAPVFFQEIATINPEWFCKTFFLCKFMVPGEVCTLCHRVANEILAKLSDPDTQLEIIETLLKGCKQVENVVPECKKLVFEYGPLILANAEKFLEATDVCSTIFACKSSQKVVELIAEA